MRAENFAEPRPELPERAATDLEAAVRLQAEHGWPFRLHATYDETVGTVAALIRKPCPWLRGAGREASAGA